MRSRAGAGVKGSQGLGGVSWHAVARLTQVGVCVKTCMHAKMNTHIASPMDGVDAGHARYSGVAPTTPIKSRKATSQNFARRPSKSLTIPDFGKGGNSIYLRSFLRLGRSVHDAACITCS